MRNAEPSRRIAILREDVSRKIAAGEVIDRPLSIVRELLDNSLDAGAGSVEVHLEAGGLGRVRIVDDGAGMDREDLGRSWLPHATSKIETEEDLLRVTSLGFRGEALSSMATASRLEIVSCRPGGVAHRLVVRGGKQELLEPCEGRPGTVVDVSELFFNYPARKKFLRSPSAEAGLCRSVFLDRASAFPGVSFRLFADGALRLSLPATDPVQRLSLCHDLDPRLLGTAEARGQGFTVRLIAASPDGRRTDRRLVQVFVNNRRVQEYSLVQAVEFGFQGFLPGGYHPVAFVFVDIDPSLVDFNIHPAKKEVRFRTLPEVHRAVVSATRAFLVGRAAVVLPRDLPSESLGPVTRQDALPFPSDRRSSPPAAIYSLPDHPPAVLPSADASIRYLGQAFGVFLVCELSDRLLLLDQHAAHERLIFERLRQQSPVVQDLLFPLAFDASADEDARLGERSAGLAEMGIVVHRSGARTWEVTGLAAGLAPLPADGLVEALRQACGRESEWRDAVLRTAACRLALKEGDPVDAVTAVELARNALELDPPRCPHGRPLWHEISRERLYQLVDRPVPR
ncbi:MAG: DNA mismatch repair endonuclease MutL [Spirochaetes bacterium]|nr:DNA mismatch repair endonuclease MutL [Spirochaetota bacterium]